MGWTDGVSGESSSAVRKGAMANDAITMRLIDRVVQRVSGRRQFVEGKPTRKIDTLGKIGIAVSDRLAGGRAPGLATKLKRSLAPAGPWFGWLRRLNGAINKGILPNEVHRSSPPLSEPHMDIGYGRLATTEHPSRLDWLKKELVDEGAKVIFVEQTSVDGPHKQREAAIDRCHHGDTLIVMTPIRLAQSLSELLKIVDRLEKKGAALHIRALGISTGTPPGETMLHTMQIISAFEREAARERQLEGMAKAKAAGKYHGRRATPDEKVRQALDLAREGVTRKDIAKRLGIGVATVYRILGREKSNLPGDQDGAPK